jgi:hypothetical protein
LLLKICAITPTHQLTGTTPLSEMNEVENDDIEIVINLNEDNHDDVLNVPISQAEIRNVILK